MAKTRWRYRRWHETPQRVRQKALTSWQYAANGAAMSPTNHAREPANAFNPRRNAPVQRSRIVGVLNRRWRTTGNIGDLAQPNQLRLGPDGGGRSRNANLVSRHKIPPGKVCSKYELLSKCLCFGSYANSSKYCNCEKDQSAANFHHRKIIGKPSVKPTSLSMVREDFPKLSRRRTAPSHEDRPRRRARWRDGPSAPRDAEYATCAASS